LTLAGAPFRIVEAATWVPDSALEELRRVNPLQQIPTLLLPDGSVLTESAAILIHLGLAFPDAQLLPADPSRRAQAIRGLVFIAANCYAAIGVIDYPERFCEGAEEKADDAVRERIRRATRARLHRYWDTFADGFDASLLFAGADPDANPSALGLLAAVVSRWSGARAHLKRSRPAFAAALVRIETHPRLTALFQRHWPPA
jgi:GST-like protein